MELAPVDLTHLRYFEVIARCGSLTAAAQSLRVSQPTLTVAMRKLEQRLQTTLLLRSRNGVQLTSTGQQLLHQASEVFALLDRAEQQIRGLEVEEAGRFVIGCPEVLGAYMLPTFLAQYLKTSPKIEISLLNGPSRVVQQAVLARDAQFGLVVRPMPHPELVLIELFSDATDLFVAAKKGADTPAAAKERLLAGPLIYVDHLPQSQELINKLREDKLLPQRQLSCGNLELVKSLTLGGVGVGVIPRRVAAYGQEGKLRRLHQSLPHIDDTIYLAYRADIHRTKAAMRLKDALVAHGKRTHAAA
jgi:DNA-binding transcriptional LysR family regulator